MNSSHIHQCLSSRASDFGKYPKVNHVFKQLPCDTNLCLGNLEIEYSSVFVFFFFCKLELMCIWFVFFLFL